MVGDPPFQILRKVSLGLVEIPSPFQIGTEPQVVKRYLEVLVAPFLPQGRPLLSLLLVGHPELYKKAENVNFDAEVVQLQEHINDQSSLIFIHVVEELIIIYRLANRF